MSGEPSEPMADDGDNGDEPKTYPTPFQRKTLWTAITAVAIVVTGAIGVGAVWLSTWILSFLQAVLVPLAVAGIVAYLLTPIIDWLQKKGWTHARSMMTVYVGFLLAILLLAVAVIVPTVGQAQDFYQDWDDIQVRVGSFVESKVTYFQKKLPLEDERYQKHYQRGVKWLSEEGPELAADAGVWVWNRLRGAFGFFGYLVGLLLVPVYLFFFLKEGHIISESWSDYLPLRASEFKDEVVATLKEINQYLISFFRGQMVVSMIDGALVAIALLVMGLPYALLIGVFLAILGLIPYIGNLLVMIPAVLIAIAHFGATESGVIYGEGAVEIGKEATISVVEAGKSRLESGVVTSIGEDGATAEVLANAWTWLPHVWVYPVIVLAIFLVLQQINGLVTAPKIVGDSVGLHPLTVIFSVLFWAVLLGGLLGALLAVPLTASVKVLFRRYIWERKLEPAVEGRLGPIPDRPNRGESSTEEASIESAEESGDGGE